MRVRLWVMALVVVLAVLAGCGSKRGMYRDRLDSTERQMQARAQAEQAKATATAAALSECAKKTDAGAIAACMLGVGHATLAQQVGAGANQQPVVTPEPPQTIGDKLLGTVVAIAPALVNGAVAWRQSDNQVDTTHSNNATQQALYAGAFGAAGQAVTAMRDASVGNAQAQAQAGAANSQAVANVALGAVAGNTAAVQSIAAVLPDLAPEINTTVGRDQVTVTGDENETSTGLRAGNDLAQVVGDGNETRQNSSGPNPGGTINCSPGNAGTGGNGSPGGNGGNSGGTTGPGGNGATGGNGGPGGSTGGADCGAAPGGG